MERPLDTQNITQTISPEPGPDNPLIPGSVLATRYQIQDIIGVGGMGSVYRARDLHFPNANKIVAVKEMINQVRDPIIRQSIMENFEREANLLVTLSHASIPRIFDFFNQNDRSYLVEEFIPGKNLEMVLKETPDFLTQDQVISWAIELCDVLSYLHSHKPEPIIFRDMKPSNIMVNKDNHIFLIDFGIAKLFKVGQRGTMIGTEGYSPPEQYRGEASLQADIYALGATLHHLLSKRDPRLEPPFTFSERPISKYNPSVTPDLETIVETSLKYEPKDRFKSADEMKAALIGVAQKTGVLPALFKPTNPIIQTEGIKPIWKFECEDEIRGSPTIMKEMVLVGSYDNNLYALNSSKGEFCWKYATDGGIVGRPAVFEDIIYIGSEDRRVHAISDRSGKVIWTYFTEGPVRSSPRVAEGHIFIGSDDGYLHTINLITSRRAWRVEAGSPIRSTPFVSHEYVYFGSESGDLFCVDFRGEVKWRYKAKRAITSSPLVDKGAVYFSSMDGSFNAVDAKTGWVIWRTRLGKGSISSPAKVDEALFIGSIDGCIYCFEAGTSKELWRFKTNHQVNGSPVIYRDALYCGSVDGYIYCLDSSTGHLRWKYQTGGPITGSPVVYNDLLYVGSTDHFIYALVV